MASLYYQEELTQNEIAAHLGLSRVKIYRLLKEAKAANVVQISVSWPLRRDRGLERDLKQIFRLDEALVLKTRGVSDSAGHKLAHLGQLGARYLEQILSDGCTMAVCLGRTSYETIHAISPNFQARVRVAQAVGSMPQALQELDSAALAGELARKLGGEVLYLTSPLMELALEQLSLLKDRIKEANEQAGKTAKELSRLVKDYSSTPQDFDRLLSSVEEQRQRQVEKVWEQRSAMLGHIRPDEWRAIMDSAKVAAQRQ